MNFWLEFSSDAFIAAFFLYCFGFIFYMIAIGGKKYGNNRKPEAHVKRWSRIAFIVSILGLAAHLTSSLPDGMEASRFQQAICMNL